MTDGLLPGADRDLVRPLHKTAGKAVRRRSISTPRSSPWPTSRIRSRSPSRATCRRRSSGSAACWLSVGRRPNSDGLGLEKTKVQVDEQGFIAVDPQRRTADPHILAIGDVAGQPMLAHKATHEGKAAVEALAGQAAAFEPRAIPAVVFTDPEIAWAGLTETEAKRAGPHGRGGPVPLGRQRPGPGHRPHRGADQVDHRSRRRSASLGCGIVGAGAGDLIAEAVLAIEMGCSVRDVAETIHPHPDAQRNAGLRRRGLLRHGHRPVSAAEEVRRAGPSCPEGLLCDVPPENWELLT